MTYVRVDDMRQHSSGHFADADGAGVLGKKTTDSDAPFCVEGAVPNTSSGYGLSTPHDARVSGTAELVGLSGAVTDDHQITDLPGEVPTVEVGVATAKEARPNVDDWETTVENVEAITLGIGPTVTDDGDEDETID